MTTRNTAGNTIRRLARDKWRLFKAEMSQAKRGIKKAMCLELVFAVVVSSCFVAVLVGTFGIIAGKF